jgi:hypothetical protein
MKSVSSLQQSRYGTLTLAAKLGWYEVLALHAKDGVETMFVVVPVQPKHARSMAKELRAIARVLTERSRGTR